MSADQLSRGMAAKNRIIGDRIVQRPRSTGAAEAAMLQFPIDRRRDVIAAKTTTAVVRARSPITADKHVAKALRSFMNELRRQGIPAIVVKREVYALEAQIRGAVWTVIFPWVGKEKLRRRSRQQIPKNYHCPSPAQLDLPFFPVGDSE
jgi:CMP-N-acetylneuraminic acid synthetase